MSNVVRHLQTCGQLKARYNEVWGYKIGESYNRTKLMMNGGSIIPLLSKGEISVVCKFGLIEINPYNSPLIV